MKRRLLREELERIKNKIKESGEWKEEFKKGGCDGGDERGIKEQEESC